MGQWSEREDGLEDSWRQEGEKRKERWDWVGVQWKGIGTRKERGDWARNIFGGRRGRRVGKKAGKGELCPKGAWPKARPKAGLKAGRGGGGQKFWI